MTITYAAHKKNYLHYLMTITYAAHKKNYLHYRMTITYAAHKLGSLSKVVKCFGRVSKLKQISALTYG